METIFLTRRNLLTLLSKLDRKVKGDKTECAIVKFSAPGKFVQSVDAATIIAVEDAEFYGDKDRDPGAVHSADLPALMTKH